MVLLQPLYFFSQPNKAVYKNTLALAGVAQFVGTRSCKPNGCRFNSQSGHIPVMLFSKLRASGRQVAILQKVGRIDLHIKFFFFNPHLSTEIMLSDFRERGRAGKRGRVTSM